MTPSEKFVSDLCQASFLPFWSFPNPIGKKGKELCDVFAVCGNHILIFSVKDITVSTHKDESVQYERWLKKAVNDSVDQIYGAERFLSSVDSVKSKEGVAIALPPKSERKIYRIAVAFGSKPEFSLPTGEFGKGFVHVFDEESTLTVLSELDTITDFTDYLSAKEKFIADKRIMIPREVDFLAFYLDTGLEIEQSANFVVIDSGMWEDYKKSEVYQEWKKDIPQSFIWDRLIRQMHDYHTSNDLSDQRRQELEECVRQINLEPRRNRIELGIVLNNAIERKVRGRMVKPPESGHGYVFVPLSDKNWEGKDKELAIRCFIARADMPEAKSIIGLSIGSTSSGESHFDFCMLEIPELTDEMIFQAKQMKEELGFFRNPQMSRSKGFRK